MTFKIRTDSYSVRPPPPLPDVPEWVAFFLFGAYPGEYIRAVEYRAGNPATPARVLSTWNVSPGHWWLSFVDDKRVIGVWGNRIVVMSGGPVVELARIEEWDPLGGRIDSAYQFAGPVSVPDSGDDLASVASITRPMVDVDGSLKWVELEFDETARTHTWHVRTAEHAATAAEGAPTLNSPGTALTFQASNDGLSPLGTGRDIREPVIESPITHSNHGLYRSGGIYQWDVSVRHRDYTSNPSTTRTKAVTVKLSAVTAEETDVLNPTPMTSSVPLDGGNLAPTNAGGPPFALASRLHQDRALSSNLFPTTATVYPQCTYVHDGVYGVSLSGAANGEGQVVTFPLAGGQPSTVLFDLPFPVLDPSDAAALPPGPQKTFLGAVPGAALL